VKWHDKFLKWGLE